MAPTSRTLGPDRTEAGPGPSPGAPGASAARLRDLTLHLAKRELDVTHRMTVLGWAWPLVRQLALLGVLVFIFSNVLELGIDNYATFVFTGLIAWSWFATGITSATSSLVAQRHLLFQPRFPGLVLPIVALAVPLLDVLLALPVLLVLVATSQGLPWTIALVPLLLVGQFVLMAGLAWMTAALSVFFRDVPNIVGVGLLLLFYLTPIFYALRNLPSRFERALQLNPLTTIVEAYRAALLGDPAPSPGRLAAVFAFSVLVAVGGFVFFHRVQHRFVDYL
jgi:ABC-type polysaccharide/polyol phosphate export permease